VKRRTAEDKVRQEAATADKIESEVWISRIKEMQELVKLFDTMKRLNAVPVLDKDGNVTFLKAPADIDWNEIQDKLFKIETPMLTEQSSEVEPESPQKTPQDELP